MNPALIAPFLRLRFRLTSKDGASRIIRTAEERYVGLADHLDPVAGGTPVRVPAMIGVDPDMRDWSFWMLLEHNAIVNRSITAVTVALAGNRDLDEADRIDPKRDVMPSPGAGPEQVAALQASIAAHLQAVALLGRMRGTATRPHPLFGDFDAHKWHCMFGFHLNVHMRQAREIVARARG